MAIYGYDDEGDAAAEEPLRLSEVTFNFPPAELRRIGHFLLGCADEIESGKFLDGGRHVRDYDRTWSAEKWGDVIVVPPDGAGTE